MLSQGETVILLISTLVWEVHGTHHSNMPITRTTIPKSDKESESYTGVGRTEEGRTKQNDLFSDTSARAPKVLIEPLNLWYSALREEVVLSFILLHIIRSFMGTSVNYVFSTLSTCTSTIFVGLTTQSLFVQLCTCVISPVCVGCAVKGRSRLVRPNNIRGFYSPRHESTSNTIS